MTEDKVTVRAICQHISCNAPCKEITVELKKEEFEKYKAQARSMHPLDIRPLMAYKCKIANHQIYEIAIVNDNVIEGKKANAKELLRRTEIKLEQLKADNARQEKVLMDEIGKLKGIVEKDA